MRGLTSHARHAHEVNKNELKDMIQSSNNEKSDVSKIIGGIGLTLLAILTLGKLK